MKKILGVIPSRLHSTRLPNKPLVDICGKPMVWWVHERARNARGLDDVVVATDDEQVAEVCDKYQMQCVMTSSAHSTPTSRIHEVSTLIDSDFYAFISGDEPLIEPASIDAIAFAAKEADNVDAVNAMIAIDHASEVIDPTNIKVVTNTNGFLLYATRSPLPFPKGRLDFDYMKFVGIGAFSKNALDIFNRTPRSKLEQIEECDLLRFIDRGVKVKMVKVNCESLSVDTPKDLEIVRHQMERILNGGGGLTAIIPVKKNSTRLPNKNILPFGKTNLLIHKIRQLKQVPTVDKIVVSTDSDEMLKMAADEGVIPMRRPQKYADESRPISEFVMYLGDVVEGDHFMWSCVTSPLVGAELYSKAIELYFEKLQEGYDSLVTVAPFKHYLMDENGPFNFSRGREHPNSQKLKKLYLFTNGIQLTPRTKYKEWGDRIGLKPYLMEVGKREAIDIDDVYDYRFALSMLEQ